MTERYKKKKNFEIKFENDAFSVNVTLRLGVIHSVSGSPNFVPPKKMNQNVQSKIKWHQSSYVHFFVFFFFCLLSFLPTLLIFPHPHLFPTFFLEPVINFKR